MATKSKAGKSIQDIAKDIKDRVFSPIYLLYGDDAYSSGQMMDFMESSILTEDEREFNQSVLYGSDVSVDDIIIYANRFPMMSEYQVVLVKEAQLLKEFKLFEPYVEKPQNSTILILNFNGKNPDKRITAVQKIFKDYITIEFPGVKEDSMPSWVSSYFSKKGFSIEAKASLLLSEFTGPDLARAVMEAEKLILNEKPGYHFTSGDLEKYVGLNKEYNIFELQNALGRRDIYKSNSIAFYIAKNQKERPLPVIISNLYAHFSKVLLYHYLKSKGEANIASSMGTNIYRVRDYEIAARNFSPAKLIHVIHHLRKADLQFKGYPSGSIDTEGILKELIFKIVH
ncbi:MAG: DNA polymerase III subunit delta [Bacteroidia bacterium]